MERRPSIFDSHSEFRTFRLLESVWGSDYLISDHLPVRNVLGFEQIKALDLPERDVRYLLSADFDFVVCTKDQGEPLIVVEFDGYTRGYSQNGQHVSKLADDDRRHKFNTKLTACSFYQMPMVIVSNEEAFWGDDDMLTVLDAIVGSVIAAKHTGEDVRLQMNELSRALEEDPTGDAAGAVLDAITFENELKYNPVVRRTAEMRKQIGYSGGEGIEFLRDTRHLGYVGGRFAIRGGVKMSPAKCEYYEYFAVSMYLRAVNCFGCSEVSLLYELGHYLLLFKAIKRFGSTREEFARNIKPHGRWVER